MTPDPEGLIERLCAMYSHRGDGVPTQYVNPDGPEAADELQRLSTEVERLERNRDMWKGQCERQAEKLRELAEDVRIWKSEAENRSEGMVQLNLDRASMGVRIMRLEEALEQAIEWDGCDSEGVPAVWLEAARQALSPSVGEDHPPITTDGRRG